MSKERKGTHARKLPKEKDNSLFSFIPKEKRKTAGTIAIAVLAVAVILFVLTKFDLIRWNGHLRYFNGKVYAQSDDVTVNAGTSSKPEYFSAGKFAGTDKYAYDPEFKMDSRKLRNEWSYQSEQADPIYLMQVYGSAESAKAMFDKMIEGYTTSSEEGTGTLHGTTGEAISANGLKYYYLTSESIPVPYIDLYYLYGITDTDYYQVRAFAYVETGDSCCAAIRVVGKADEEADLPGSEQLLSRIGEFADLIYAETPSGTDVKPIAAYTEAEEPAEVIAGYYAGTEKYDLDEEYTAGSTNQLAGWKYDGNKGDPIYFMYVGGVNNSAEKAKENYKGQYTVTNEEDGTKSFNGSEREGTNANGLKYYWAITETQTNTDYLISSKYGIEYPERYVKYSCAYVETTDDLCVMVAVYAKADIGHEDDMPSDEAIFERALELIDLVDKP